VALYEPRFRGPDVPADRNIELMGYASGKVANYLHGGLPIVTSDLVGLRDLSEGRGCGHCVRSASEVRDALDAIMADREGFTERVCSAFDDCLELEKHFSPVVDRIIALTLSACSTSGLAPDVRGDSMGVGKPAKP
jgi:hypothetical protein